MNYQDDYIYLPDAEYRATLSHYDLGLIEGLDFYDNWQDSLDEVTLPFTEFENKYSNIGVESQICWRDFTKYVIGSGHSVMPTKSGKLIGGYWLKEDATRSNINVEEVFVFICDVDGKPGELQPPTLDEMKAKFQPQSSSIFGCKVLGYTTYSHSLQYPRYRLIFPLARAVAPSEYEALWLGFNAALGGILDPVTKDISRIHYLPSCPAENLSIASWFSANDAGHLPMVNPEPLIVEGIALCTPQKPAKTYISTTPETPREIARVQEMLDHISADCDYETYRDVVWSVLSTGWTCAEQLAENWCQTAPHRFEEDDFINVVNSYNPNKVAPITLGTLNFLAKKGGWNG
jgi:putative DNA primase/helicase